MEPRIAHRGGGGRPRLATRLAPYAAGSVLLWAAATGAAYWYLRRGLPAEVRALPVTHADSIGLPLLAASLLVAAALVVANLAVAIVLLRRRRAASRREIG
jgi:hypothetical protein